MLILWFMGNKIFLSAFLFILINTEGLAQNHWNVEIQPGLNFPAGNIAGLHLEIGYGADVQLAYKFLPNLSAFAGWGWNNFKSDESSLNFEETGYSFGLLFIHPIRKTPLSYILSGGMVYKHIEVENNSGEIISDTDHEPGWQVAAGLDIPMGSSLFSLRPIFRYHSLSAEPHGRYFQNDLHLKYLSVGIGVSKIF